MPDRPSPKIDKGLALVAGSRATSTATILDPSFRLEAEDCWPTIKAAVRGLPTIIVRRCNSAGPEYPVPVDAPRSALGPDEARRVTIGREAEVRACGSPKPTGGDESSHAHAHPQPTFTWTEAMRVEICGREVGSIGYGMLALTKPGTTATEEQCFAALRAALSMNCNLWDGGEFYGSPDLNSLTLL
ncbi:hypothetical protein MMC26_001468 [Xylographa opegraphella]|nr:hypothetical protein [Xylographa opegraphella]